MSFFQSLVFYMFPGPVMIDLLGTSLEREERELLSRPEVGGIIFFARNFVSRQQIRELTSEIAALRPELLLAVDQEGGRVQRLLDGYTLLPSAQKLGDFYTADKQAGGLLLKDVGWLMAVEVIASGLDFSFAPVLDLDRHGCEVIADRSFSDDPDIACQILRHYIDGMHEAGMAATGKHFPGHGGVSGDSHLETPEDLRDLRSLESRDLIPFKNLIDRLQAIMPAHIIFPRIDPLAAGFSRFWLQDILRSKFSFGGVIFSDDLSMKGADVGGGYVDKARLAFTAGCDMVLVCNNRAGAIEVLDFVAKNQGFRRPDLLSAMKAKTEWEWPDLERNTRRRAAVNALRRIV